MGYRGHGAARDGRVHEVDGGASRLRFRRADCGPHRPGRPGALAEGNPGDARPVGGGVGELRIHHGPGFRVYFVRDGDDIVLLLGGTKKTQSRDIKNALKMAQEL